MTKLPDDSTFYRFFRGSYIVAWAIFCGTLLAYFLNFGLGSHGFSKNPAAWAEFGEYVGGFLGGTFGLFALISVLMTLGFQRKQLQQLSAQSTIDELQRICRDLASSIDLELSKDLILNSRDGISPTLSTPHLGRTSRDVLDQVPQVTVPPTQGAASLPGLARMKPTLRGFYEHTHVEIDLLGDCLQDMLIWGGSVVIYAYYRNRYGLMVRRLQLLGYQVKAPEFWAKKADE